MYTGTEPDRAAGPIGGDHTHKTVRTTRVFPRNAFLARLYSVFIIFSIGLEKNRGFFHHHSAVKFMKPI